jgi:hypothetical protein
MDRLGRIYRSKRRGAEEDVAGNRIRRKSTGLPARRIGEVNYRYYSNKPFS